MFLNIENQNKLHMDFFSVFVVSYRFGHVCQNQGVGDPELISTTFKKILQDCYQQELHFTISSDDDITDSHHRYYLRNANIRTTLIMFRVGVSLIKKYLSIPLEALTTYYAYLFCMFCKNNKPHYHPL